VFARRNKVPLVNIGDAACMVVPVGLCFGRIANFINGELYGHATTVPWAVQFPSELIAPTNNVYDISPARRLELAQRVAEQVPWYADHLALMPRGLDFGERLHYQMSGIISLVQQHNPKVEALLRDVLIPRHPSQLYEAGLEGVLLFALVWTIGRLWRKDGMAGGAFLVGYPIMRIIGEQFRVGDTPLNVLGVEISKGVLYSLLMLIPAGMYWLYWIRRKQAAVWVRPGAAAKVTGGREEARK
jgi:phosphatidylglycerol:prolipoprotein diacylglycerol transferase